ncbi:Uncharacterized membrane protein [Clostridium cavendishii DSM 21758]|uniref:Uncharacterized membrane protein n=1 Tax=Clostridium cavendishii DSM 21758 TaxID=1121302 RepID=A0A1M6V8J5_9CLOT|nr:DUF1634 domain-containing protein [Clostridium cavendishii]SHK77636.1 Uncharacterized membrane protein [Clostridium cavendishii DSM 21758]
MRNSEIEEVELFISKALRVGVLISAIFIIIGLSMFLITGNSGYEGDYFPTSIIEVFSGVVTLKAYSIISLGLLILIFTPIFRVAISILVFIKAKDYLYVKITSIVLTILIISLIIGKAL